MSRPDYGSIIIEAAMAVICGFEEETNRTPASIRMSRRTLDLLNEWVQSQPGTGPAAPGSPATLCSVPIEIDDSLPVLAVRGPCSHQRSPTP